MIYWVYLVQIDSGNSLGIKTTGMLLHMDDPVGNKIGNSLEILEAVECLKGEGPQDLIDTVCKMGNFNLVWIQFKNQPAPLS